MDTSSTHEIDILGRRGGPRRRWPIEEKRRIVEETLLPGASVAMVAQRYELNPNMVFIWRRLYRDGLLGKPRVVAQTPLLPVQLLGVRAGSAFNGDSRKQVGESDRTAGGSFVEIQFADGTQLRAEGKLAHEALRELMASVRTR